jgi:DNA-binding transcriptional ArsR family regulator
LRPREDPLTLRAHAPSRPRRARRFGGRAAAGSDVYLAIGEPTRRRLLDALATGEKPVRELARPFRMSRPAVSQHLRILLDAGLVRARRAGRQRLYRLRVQPLREVYDWVAHYEHFWKAKLQALGEYLDRQTQAQEPAAASSARPEDHARSEP